jgi:hypothetical protein
MDKDTIIKKLIEAGYTTDLTLVNDCLYCANTETSYLLQSFKTDKEITFNNMGKEYKIRAVSSEEYNLKGFYFIN